MKLIILIVIASLLGACQLDERTLPTLASSPEIATEVPFDYEGTWGAISSATSGFWETQIKAVNMAATEEGSGN